MSRRRRTISKSRHKQRQMLVAIQVLFMVGILAFVIIFRDHFGIVTSSFVSAFDAQDVKVKDHKAKTEQPDKAAPSPQAPDTPSKLE